MEADGQVAVGVLAIADAVDRERAIDDVEFLVAVQMLGAAAMPALGIAQQAGQGAGRVVSRRYVAPARVVCAVDGEILG